MKIATPLRCLAVAAAVTLATTASSSAHADTPAAPAAATPAAAPPASPPPVPPGYQLQPIAPPGYTAPLYQQTQPSYVPQSVALSGPREIGTYEPGETIPAGYRPVERSRKGLIIGGAITFGVMYFFSALVAADGADSAKYSNDSNPVAALWVPGIGPFIQMASTESSSANLILAIDGLAQSAGLAMLIYGIASPKTVLVRNDLASNKPTVRAVPMVGNGSSGFSLVGTF